ncbi:hypothetical protein B0H14DRAFT_3741683 [Mycena olivaceomarginata]|nr:hypothetical protein B0H14DRAFT_3741683 [Mycena olivaceomarginata]
MEGGLPGPAPIRFSSLHHQRVTTCSLRDIMGIIYLQDQDANAARLSSALGGSSTAEIANGTAYPPAVRLLAVMARALSAATNKNSMTARYHPAVQLVSRVSPLNSMIPSTGGAVQVGADVDADAPTHLGARAQLLSTLLARGERAAAAELTKNRDMGHSLQALTGALRNIEETLNGVLVSLCDGSPSAAAGAGCLHICVAALNVCLLTIHFLHLPTSRVHIITAGNSVRDSSRRSSSDCRLSARREEEVAAMRREVRVLRGWVRGESGGHGEGSDEEYALQDVVDGNVERAGERTRRRRKNGRGEEDDDDSEMQSIMTVLPPSPPSFIVRNGTQTGKRGDLDLLKLAVSPPSSVSDTAPDRCGSTPV